MKKILSIILMIQLLLSINLYKEIKIDRDDLFNLSYLQTFGIDIDHVYSTEDYFQFAINVMFSLFISIIQRQFINAQNRGERWR